MKKIVLLSAITLPLAFAACNNEDVLSSAEQETMETVVGANLAAKGIVLTPAEGATSRLNKDGWESADRLGLAWVISTGTDITTEQLPSAFSWTDFAGLSDSKIFANHMFEYNGSSFGYYGDIYEGAYFAYWPFQKLGSIKAMPIKLQNTQTVASAAESYLNNAFAISAVDTVRVNHTTASTVKESVSKSFDLVKVANGINVNTSFVGTNDVTNYKIGSVTITTEGKDLFSTTANLDPHKLPFAVYTKTATDNASAYVSGGTTGTLAKMTQTNLIGSNKAIAPAAAAATLTTNVAVDMPLKENNTVSLLTFPTVHETVTAPDVKITVTVVTPKADGTNETVGTFDVAYVNNSTDADVKANNDAVSKLAALLNGGYTQGGQTYSLQEFNNVSFGINLKLKMSMFTQTKAFEVTATKSWDAIVDEIDALGLTTATIKYAGKDVVATKFPAKATITIDGAVAKSFTASGAVNKNVNLGSQAITIAKDTELTLAKDATLTSGAITDNGTFNVNGTTASAITINKDSAIKGIMNIGADGKATGTVKNNNIINITPSATAGRITDATLGGTINVTFDKNSTAAMINATLGLTTAANQKLTVVFDGATLDGVTGLEAGDSYTTTGDVTFKGTINAAAVPVTVESGTVTFAKDAVVSLGALTIKTATVNVKTANTEGANAKVTLASVSGAGTDKSVINVTDKSTLTVTATVTATQVNVEKDSTYNTSK